MAAVAAKLVAEGGVDAVTVRDVAAKVGMSTAIVSHYFRDKRELLLFTFGEAARTARVRLDAVLTNNPADLVGVIESLLPLDEERRQEWQVWFAFWGRAVTDPELGAEQRRRVERTRETLFNTLRAARPDMKPAAAEFEARRLLTLINGIAAQAVFEPDNWPAATQRRLVKATLGA